MLQGEEGGLLGSARTASQYKSAGKTVRAMLQLDMVRHFLSLLCGISLSRAYCRLATNQPQRRSSSCSTTLPLMPAFGHSSAPFSRLTSQRRPSATRNATTRALTTVRIHYVDLAREPLKLYYADSFINQGWPGGSINEAGPSGG